jgi:hypothetical protein
MQADCTTAVDGFSTARLISSSLALLKYDVVVCRPWVPVGLLERIVVSDMMEKINTCRRGFVSLAL